MILIRIVLFKSTIQGRIDQINQVLELDSHTKGNVARYDALHKFGEHLSSLHNSISAKINV